MTSKTTQAVRNAIALCMTGFAGFSSTSVAAPPAAEPALKSFERANDLTLPAIAKRGTGSVGALNAKALDAPAMSFALPDGRVLSATRQRTADDRNKGRKSWIGTFAEQPGSVAVVTTYKGVTTGFVSFGAETWEVMPAKAGKHMLYRIDDSKLPTVEPEVLMSEAENDLAATASDADVDTTTSTAGGFVHDLLVVYTPAASAAYGQATLESMIQNAVTVANQAYQNSKVGITLNLVGLQQIAYTEVDIQTSLDDLRGTTDGKMDSVHRLRDQVGADIVSLISEDTGACGIARVMTTVSTAFAPYAFNVVKTGCLSQHSLTHEIGHNQGNKHDRTSTTGSGAYPYSYGFRRCVTDGTGFRTVMAYSCSGAARVAWFSNPNAYYNGYATGIDYASDPENSADNARSMNNTAATIAALRGASNESIATVTPTTPSAPSSLSASATAHNSVTVRWTDNSGDETGFRLERSGNGVDFSEIATLGAGTTSFVDNGVVASSSYYYKVRAYSSVGNSSYSNTGSVTTPAVPAPAPAAPASVAAVNDGDGSATVSWVDSSTNETGFEIRREKWDAKRSKWSGLKTVGTVPSNLTSLVDVTGNGTFRYSVRAVNSGGASGLAGPAAVTVTGGATRGKRGE